MGARKTLNLELVEGIRRVILAMKPYILFWLLSFCLPSLSLAQNSNTPVREKSLPVRAFPAALPDGTSVLLRSGKHFALIILEKQSSNPEYCDFRWYLRSDGGVDFGDIDAGTFPPGVTTGVFRGHALVLEPFTLTWSGHSKGFGWVYYPDDVFMGVALSRSKDEPWIAISLMPMLKAVSAIRYESEPKTKEEVNH